MEGAPSDSRLVELLRAGDESAFCELVRRHNNAMIRFAETFVPSRAVAEEVAQEAWLGVIKGIDRIVANIGRTRGERERRATSTVSLSEELAGGGPSVPHHRFQGRPGHGV